MAAVYKQKCEHNNSRHRSQENRWTDIIFFVKTETTADDSITSTTTHFGGDSMKSSNVGFNHVTPETAAPTAIEDYSETVLYAALKPLIISMKMIGLHHIVGAKKTASSTSCSRSRLPTPPAAQQIYSWSVVVFFWSCLIIQTISTFQVPLTNFLLVNSLASLCFLAENVLKVTCFVIASHRLKAMRKIFTGFEKLDEFGGCLTNLTKVRCILTWTCVSFWTFYFCFIAAYAYFLFATPYMDTVIPSLGTTGPPSVGFKILYSAFVAYELPVWPIVNVFELTMGIVIHSEVSQFCKSLRAKTEVKGRFNGSLETERRKYTQLTRIVEAADRSLSLYHASSFCANIIILCLLIYNMVYMPGNLRAAWICFAYMIWILGAFFDLCIVCFSGTLISAAVS